MTKVDREQVNRIFEDFATKKAVIIGDVMIDNYLWGKVERISPEAPIPIVSVTRHEKRLGGAANVSLNIRALGATPYLFSVIGDDENGKSFIRLLKDRNLEHRGILVEKGRKTTVKNRIISRGQHIARVDEETTELIHAGLEEQLGTAIEKLLNSGKIDVIIFVDYDKGVITPSLFERVNRKAIEKGIPVAVDPKKRNFHLYKNIALFKPNFSEFVEGIGINMDKNNLEELGATADELRKKQNLGLIFITLSEKGVFISNGEKKQSYPAEVRDIADVSGAGDTVISVAALALASGMKQETMALMSNLAGGLVCEKAGVVPVDREQLLKEMLIRDI